MTDHNETPAVEQRDREGAWPFRAECYGAGDHAGWMRGKYDHNNVIQAFARHRLQHSGKVATGASAHKMVPGGYGHGAAHCERCLATNREIAFALGPVCPNAPTPALANRGDAVERNLEAQRQTIEACARVAERGWIPSYVTGDLSDPEKWEPGSPYDRGEVAACKRIAASIRALRPNAMLAAHPASDREARLCAVLRECADDLEAEVRDRWGYDERLKHKLDRDMVPVMKARALLAEIEGTTRP